MLTPDPYLKFCSLPTQICDTTNLRQLLLKNISKLYSQNNDLESILFFSQVNGLEGFKYILNLILL